MSSVLLLGSENDPHSERPVARVDEVYQVQLQVAKLTSDVEHIKIDVGDIKIDLRKLTGSVGESETRLDGKIENLATRLDGKIDALDTRLTGKIDALDARLTGKIDVVDAKLAGKIDAVDTRLHKFEKDVATQFGEMKVWMLGLHLAQATGLLLIMAKGFKWL